MLPEVENYYTVANTSQNTRFNDEQRARQEHPLPVWRDDMTADERRAYFAAEVAQAAAMMKARQDHQERKAAALEGLRNSEDPMVRFIVNTPRIFQDYPVEARIVLQALPMTREELEEFGNAKGWCDTFDMFLGEAEDAGALPGQEPGHVDIRPLVNALNDYFGYTAHGRSQVRRIVKEQLPALLEQAKQAESQSA